ncbi:MAG: ACP S-malonyltransferase [Planctomycetaceae bacterium]|jgi:[acyl-carrier-protein] S-malonyltransferase|nr:ACP S-malonyltransferase [Planctomycetaceae bacterium]
MSSIVLLCPGQGAQAVGMARAWCEANPKAKAVVEEADRIFAGSTASASVGGRTLSDLAFNGPIDVLSRTDISQPALYTAAVACFHALPDDLRAAKLRAVAGLSLGEYTALHLAGAFDFATGLRLVMRRGELMQQAAEASRGGMVALIGADEAQANEVCARALAAGPAGECLVPANFNAPGQIVLSGSIDACDRAVTASDGICRATKLQVAGAFHSPLMAPAAEKLAEALAKVDIRPLAAEVWSNVTARPHDASNAELLRKLLVEQLVSPVRWAQSCANLLEAMVADGSRTGTAFHELAPGSVLKGLMRRIDKTCEVIPHDAP